MLCNCSLNGNKEVQENLIEFVVRCCGFVIMVLGGSKARKTSDRSKKAMNAVDTNNRLKTIHSIGMFPTAAF